jgi:hypothetical protein
VDKSLGRKKYGNVFSVTSSTVILQALNFVAGDSPARSPHHPRAASKIGKQRERMLTHSFVFL